MIDLTEAPVTRESCYARYTDPTLAHQLRIRLSKDQLSVEATCNCGALVLEFRPEDDMLDELNLAYSLHVDALL